VRIDRSAVCSLPAPIPPAVPVGRPRRTKAAAVDVLQLHRHSCTAAVATRPQGRRLTPSGRPPGGLRPSDGSHAHHITELSLHAWFYGRVLAPRWSGRWPRRVVGEIGSGEFWPHLSGCAGRVRALVAQVEPRSKGRAFRGGSSRLSDGGSAQCHLQDLLHGSGNRGTDRSRLKWCERIA
jgi:hypothetical protein